MAKTTPEHDCIIDTFDEMITFLYAYEWQKLQNNSIDRLLELRDAISFHIENKPEYYYRYLSSNPQEKLSAMIRILDRLNQATLDNSYPEMANITEGWLNTDDLKAIKKQEEESELIIMLVTNVVSSLNSSLPDEMKPFVTSEQVDAIFLKLWVDMPDRITAPIYKKLLVSLIHQYFLKMVNIKKNTHKNEISLNELIDGYFKEAKHQLITMVKEKMIDEIAIIFSPIAEFIDIEIGRYYPWGMICYLAIDYQTELLPWYACVNALGLVNDSLYIGDKAQDREIADSKLASLLSRKINYNKRRVAPKSDFKRYIFDSNRTPIFIDGNALQNYLVMAFPYDKPLPNLQEKLRDYGIHIGGWVNNYGRQFGHPSGYEDEVNSAIACRDMAPPYKRITLTNVGSVLHHICTLLCLQFERSDDYSDKLKKNHSLDVYELIRKHGFSYSHASVETARKDKAKKIRDIVASFPVQL